MNRRQFIEHGIGALTALALFPTDLFRYATGQPPREMPVGLGNRSPLLRLTDDWGIKSDEVHRRAYDMWQLSDPSEAQISQAGELSNLAWGLAGDRSAVDNVAAFSEALAECDPALAHLPLPDDDGASVRRMNRILAGNPGMSRADAFFGAVIEGVEETL